MKPFRVIEWDALWWESGGMLAAFFGIVSFVTSFLEPVLSDRLFDLTLFVFGLVCLTVGWLALNDTVRREKRKSLN